MQNSDTDPSLSPPPALDPSSLPPSSSPTLHLSPATPSERLACFKLNAREWRGALTTPQYLTREAYLLEQELTRDGAITHWVLTESPTPLPNSDRNILASCESIRKVLLVARNGTVQDQVSHGIASVFCRAEYRGKGYAGRMMKEVGKRLETWQASSAEEGAEEQGTNACSILYSDIGKEFYSREGWLPMPSSHVQLSLLDEAGYESIRKRLNLPKIRELKTDDIEPEVWKHDSPRVRDTLAQKSRAAPEKTLIAIRPDPEHMRWHHAREEFQAKTLGFGDPTIKGAITNNPSPDSPMNAIIWTRVYQSNPSENILHILRLSNPPPSLDQPPTTESDILATAALLLRAQREAHTWNMQAGIQLWNPTQTTLEAAKLLSGVEKDVEVVVREKESIASLRWHDKREESEVVLWEFNEKYGWC
ncbi:MAG: hypothetical protein Q9227_005222 [Pyrenula ochraceoflavens]